MTAPRLPHAAPIRCLRRIAAVGPDRWRGEAVLAPDHPGLDADGRIRPAYLVEIAAQAAAAALAAGDRAALGIGMLVALVDWRFADRTAAAGATIDIALQAGPGLGPLRAFDAVLHADGSELGRGGLRLRLGLADDDGTRA